MAVNITGVKKMSNLKQDIPWDIKTLYQTPKSESAEDVINAAENVIWKEGKPLPARPELVQAIWLQGEDYQGKATKIFAWIGIPKTKNGEKLPAMVLVHGGGGTAFAEWVAMWNRRGYAAIAIDTSGHTPCSKKYGGWPAHKFSGPHSCDDFSGVDKPIKDQWTYHAVSAVVRAHSYLCSLPEVDADRTGITGISWGGYLTCIAASIDLRFKVAIPIYGCGFLGDNSVWKEQLDTIEPQKRERWLSLWDPSSYIQNISMPILWIAFINDPAYPMDSLMKTFARVSTDKHLCFPNHYGHSHECGWGPAEISDFADSVLRPKSKISFPVITGQGKTGQNAWIEFKSAKPVTQISFHYTTDNATWNKKEWHAINMPDSESKEKISQTLPEDTKAYYFNIEYERNKHISSPITEP